VVCARVHAYAAGNVDDMGADIFPLYVRTAIDRDRVDFRRME
jgi:hypothetical protein